MNFSLFAVIFLANFFSSCASKKVPQVLYPSGVFIEEAKSTGCGDLICASIITTEALAREAFKDEKGNQTKINFVCKSAGAVESLESVCPNFRVKFQSALEKISSESVVRGPNPSLDVKTTGGSYELEILSIDGKSQQKLTGVKPGQTVQIHFTR